jgi:hypothetical protein
MAVFEAQRMAVNFAKLPELSRCEWRQLRLFRLLTGPPSKQRWAAVGARWNLPRWIWGVRSLHWPQEQVRNFLLGPFIADSRAK